MMSTCLFFLWLTFSTAQLKSTSSTRVLPLVIIKGFGLIIICFLLLPQSNSFIVFLNLFLNIMKDINAIRDDLNELKPTLFAGVPRVFEKVHEGIIISLLHLAFMLMLLT